MKTALAQRCKAPDDDLWMSAKIFRSSPIDGFRPQGFSLKKSAPPIFLGKSLISYPDLTLFYNEKWQSLSLAVGDLGTRLGKALRDEVDGFPFSPLKGSL